MMMLDAFHGKNPPEKRTRWSPIALSAALIVSLGAALPVMRAAKQDASSALVEVLASGKKSKDIRNIVENTQARLLFSKDITDRLAVGSEDILKLEKVLNKREIVVSGAKVGRTSLTVWFADGSVEQFMFSVTRDMSVLQEALRVIDPSLEAEIAPDRDVIVLRGTVRTASDYQRADDTATRYLEAGAVMAKPATKSATSGAEGAPAPISSGRVINLIRVLNPGDTIETRLAREVERIGGKGVSVRRVMQGGEANDAVDSFVIEGSVRDLESLNAVSMVAARALPGSDSEKQKRVLDRMVISDRPTEIEEIIESAIHDLGYPKVKVRKVSQTQFPGDADILVIEGKVPSQTALVRSLVLASRIFEQQEVVKAKRDKRIDVIHEFDANGQSRTIEQQPKLKDAMQDLKVVADESGALRTQGASNLNAGTQAPISLVGGSSGGSLGGNSSSSNAAGFLYNQINANIGRAKALELADGRILSFLTVEDLPQIRVDVRLLEVNRTKLLTWGSNLTAKTTNFNLPSSVRPATQFVQNPVTGEIQAVPNAPQANTDIQNIFSFLEGGLGNSFAASGGHIDISQMFNLLETEGITRTLSSPSLTVLSGELAFFGVGGTVPETQTVTTAFGSGIAAANVANSGIFTGVVERDFGIRLSVRPLVDEDGYITLDVVPSVSNPDADLTSQIRQATGVPPPSVAFQERAMRTSARLRDGQTLLIGGLNERSRTDSSNQTPGINQIPLLGWLFKSFSLGDDDRELVIVLNPVIVRDVPKEAPLWAFPATAELIPVYLPPPPPDKEHADKEKDKEHSDKDSHDQPQSEKGAK
jgi:pilus assembly protein CpaC